MLVIAMLNAIAPHLTWGGKIRNVISSNFGEVLLHDFVGETTEAIYIRKLTIKVEFSGIFCSDENHKECQQIE